MSKIASIGDAEHGTIGTMVCQKCKEKITTGLYLLTYLSIILYLFNT